MTVAANVGPGKSVHKFQFITKQLSKLCTQNRPRAKSSNNYAPQNVSKNLLEEGQGLHTPSDVGSASLVSVYQMLRMTVAAVTRRYGNFTERNWNRGLKTKNTMGDGREGIERERPGWGVWLWKRGRGEGKTSNICQTHIFFRIYHGLVTVVRNQFNFLTATPARYSILNENFRIY